MFYITAMFTRIMDGITSSFDKDEDTEVRQEISIEDNEETKSKNDGTKEVTEDTSGSEENSNESKEDDASLRVSNERESDSNNNDVSYNITDAQFYTFVNSIGDTEYCFLLEVENTGNCDLYLDECIMDLEDNDKHLLMAGEHASYAPDVIKPGEKGYFYNSVLSRIIPDDVDTSNGVNCVPNITVVKAKKTPPKYEVSDISVIKEYGSAKLTGRITNSTDKDEDIVVIYTLYYDNNNKLLGIDRTSVYDVKAGQTQSFDSSAIFMQGDSSYDDIADYKIIAQGSYTQW